MLPQFLHACSLVWAFACRLAQPESIPAVQPRARSRPGRKQEQAEAEVLQADHYSYSI